MVAVDTTQVQLIIRNQFPEVECAEIRGLAQGSDFWTVEIDGQWVFRFPTDNQVAESLCREIALLDTIADEAPLPVPEYRFRGEATESFPRRFGGYEKISGVPGMTLDPSKMDLSDQARQLGRFLNWLHGIDTARSGDWCSANRS